MPARAPEPSTFAELLEEIESRPTLWLAAILPRFFVAPFAPHHLHFWQHTWAIERYSRPRPYVGIMSRGGAKSTSAEAAVVALGARRKRRYAWYVCRSAEQAMDHVDSIASMLESPYVAAWYPEMSNRLVDKYNQSKGWRRARLRTASGFTVDAIGLDQSFRGKRVETSRPDLIVLDDVDSDDDTPIAVEQLIKLIGKKLLPSGSNDLAVIAIQNLVHGDSVFARLAGLGTKPTDLLSNRVLNGPIPAVEGLEVEQTADGFRVVAGRPTWAGQDLAVVQSQIDEWGYSAFLAEAQHEEQPPEGGIFGHLDFGAYLVQPEQVPLIQRFSIWCDVAVTDTDRSDSQAVQADGLGVDGRVYRLFSWEQRSSPVTVLTVAFTQALLYRAGFIGVETDQGGDAWLSVFREARTIVANRCREDGRNEDAAFVESVGFREEKAGAGYGGKAARAGRMVGFYESGHYRHVFGTHTILERALKRFGIRKPFDLCLVPETPILTNDGTKRLDAVIVGDEVMTRGGWRQVERAWQTSKRRDLLRLDVAGRSLVGTANHPVWTTNRGWTSLGEIRRGDMVLAWRGPEEVALSTAVTDPTTATGTAIHTGGSGRSTATLSPVEHANPRADETSRGSTGTRTTATPTPSSERTASTSTPAAKQQQPATSYTATFGRLLAVRSLTAWLSTIWTTIRSTTASTTSLLSPTPNTEPFTGRRGQTPKRWQRTWRRSANSRPTGTDPTRAANGTENTASERGLIDLSGSCCAMSAAPRSVPDRAPPTCDSAPRSAAMPSGNAATSNSEPAPRAARRSTPTSTTSSGFVAVPVPSAPRPAGSGPVWNLTVRGKHEFVASGILVHNSDAAYWCCNDLLEGGAGGSNASLLTARR